MLARQRQERILQQVRASGSARISELTALLGVSDMTVRRDLDHLAATGQLEKVHGGAVLRQDVSREPAFYTKRLLERSAKHAIAARAAQLIRPGTAVGLSAGTTTWAMVPEMAGIAGLTVVTNSVTVCETIAERLTDQVVLLTGGMLTPSAALAGPTADQVVRTLHLDQLFLGVHGMHPGAGFTTPNLAEAQTNRALIGQSGEIVVVADSTKWGTVGLASFGELSTADVLVTDSRLPDAALAHLTDCVDRVLVVDAEENSAAS